MKKTLIAVAALVATGAFAQVSVYGRLDAGYSNTTTTSAQNVDTKLNGVTSHNSVSSLWGIRGSEDLGGGLKANFKLEQDVYPANGNTGASGSGSGVTNASGFNRTSTVGVSGAFGSIDIGRDYTPSYSFLASADVFGQTRISTQQGNTLGVGSTLPEQIIYRSPSLSGFEGQLSYINQDTSVGATDTKTTGNTIVLKYTNGPLMVGFTTAVKEGTSGATVTKNSGQGIAASYNFGVFRITANSTTQKVTTNGVDGADAKETNLGFAMPMGKVTLLAAVGNNDTGAAAQNTGTDMVIGADYALSAKTALYAKTGTVNKTGDNAKTVGTTFGIKTTF